MSQVCRLPANEFPLEHNFALKVHNHSFSIALFHVCKHIRHEGIALLTSLSIFEFYTSIYAFVFAFEYQSSLEAMPTSLETANVTSKHCYNQHLGPISGNILLE